MIYAVDNLLALEISPAAMRAAGDLLRQDEILKRTSYLDEHVRSELLTLSAELFACADHEDERLRQLIAPARERSEKRTAVLTSLENFV